MRQIVMTGIDGASYAGIWTQKVRFQISSLAKCNL